MNIKKHIEKDAALERRFQPIVLGEPTVEEALKILEGLRDRYEAHHRVKITDEALKAAVELSHRYISDRYLPDKAIDLIDEAASRVRLTTLTAPPELKSWRTVLKDWSRRRQRRFLVRILKRPQKLGINRKALKKNWRILRGWEKKSKNNSKQVDEEDIAYIVSSWTGVPVKKLAQEESSDF